MTVAFGHGVSTTPLQTAVAGAALMNGGKLLPPTFLLRSEEQANEIAKVVVNERTVENMRYLFRSNVLDGSGSRANISASMSAARPARRKRWSTAAMRQCALQRVSLRIPSRQSEICGAVDRRRAEEGL